MISTVSPKSVIAHPIAGVYLPGDSPMVEVRQRRTVKTVIGIWAGHLPKLSIWVADTTNDSEDTITGKLLRQTQVLQRKRSVINWLVSVTLLFRDRVSFS